MAFHIEQKKQVERHLGIKELVQGTVYSVTYVQYKRKYKVYVWEQQVPIKTDTEQIIKDFLTLFQEALSMNTELILESILAI